MRIPMPRLMYFEDKPARLWNVVLDLVEKVSYPVVRVVSQHAHTNSVGRDPGQMHGTHVFADRQNTIKVEHSATDEVAACKSTYGLFS